MKFDEAWVHCCSVTSQSRLDAALPCAKVREEAEPLCSHRDVFQVCEGRAGKMLTVKPSVEKLMGWSGCLSSKHRLCWPAMPVGAQMLFVARAHEVDRHRVDFAPQTLRVLSKQQDKEASMGSRQICMDMRNRASVTQHSFTGYLGL